MNNRWVSRIGWTRFSQPEKFFIKEYGKQFNLKWGAIFKSCSSLCVTIARSLHILIGTLMDGYSALLNLGRGKHAELPQLETLLVQTPVSMRQFIINRMRI